MKKNIVKHGLENLTFSCQLWAMLVTKKITLYSNKTKTNKLSFFSHKVGLGK